jgi:hypothetical protein
MFDARSAERPEPPQPDWFTASQIAVLAIRHIRLEQKDNLA